MRRDPAVTALDAAAFDSLYRRHARDVYRYALALLGTASDAEDVTQATFLNAYSALRRGERPARPRNWLRAIAHNLCRQHHRQLSRRPREVALDEEIDQLVSDAPDVSLEDLLRALGHLPINQRAALVMREFEGRSLADIAALLDLSVSAVETLLFRARRSLRELLEGQLSCVEAEHAISRQLDGALARGERGALRAHLRRCPDCARVARRLRAQRRVMKSLAAVSLPPSLAWASRLGASGSAAATAAGASIPSGAASGLGVSLATKVLVTALATSALAGVGYAGIGHRLGHAPGHRHHRRFIHPAAPDGARAAAVVAAGHAGVAAAGQLPRAPVAGAQRRVSGARPGARPPARHGAAPPLARAVAHPAPATPLAPAASPAALAARPAQGPAPAPPAPLPQRGPKAAHSPKAPHRVGGARQPSAKAIHQRAVAKPHTALPPAKHQHAVAPVKSKTSSKSAA